MTADRAGAQVWSNQANAVPAGRQPAVATTPQGGRVDLGCRRWRCRDEARDAVADAMQHDTVPAGACARHWTEWRVSGSLWTVR